MRKLEIDFSRALEIKERASDALELRRVAGEKVRDAKRRVGDAERDIEVWSGQVFEVGSHPRADKTQQFHPGLAAHNLRTAALSDAQHLLDVANQRYASASSEAQYWGAIERRCREYLKTTIGDGRLPPSLRSEEF